MNAEARNPNRTPVRPLYSSLDIRHSSCAPSRRQSEWAQICRAGVYLHLSCSPHPGPLFKGCEGRATLGLSHRDGPTPTGLRPSTSSTATTPLGLEHGLLDFPG